jgi:hypothetical protein
LKRHINPVKLRGQGDRKEENRKQEDNIRYMYLSESRKTKKKKNASRAS